MCEVGEVGEVDDDERGQDVGEESKVEVHGDGDGI